jgi:hypothetical protein
MDELDSSSDERVAEKPPESDQRASTGAKKKKQKRKKRASKKSEILKEKADANENGEEEGGKGADSSVDASDDHSDDEDMSKEERVRRFHAKRAKTDAIREKFWLEQTYEPIRVREDSKGKGRTVKYLSNHRYTVGVANFERTVKHPRVFTSCIKCHRSNLSRHKNINIVAGMICRLSGDNNHMFMMHSIEVQLQAQNRYTTKTIFCKTSSKY